jgi:hypothetical protein
VCSAPAAFRNCARRIARPLFGRPGQGEKLTQADYGSAIAAGVRPTRHEISRRVFATIPAGRRRAAAACGRAPHVALGWAKWPRAARAGGGGAVPGRRPAINCQKFTALWLFKPSSESEPYPPRQKTRQLSRGKQRGILGRLSAAVADRPDGWRGRAKPAGRNRARVSRTAGPRSSVGLLGAGTSPQPGLAGINRGPGRLIAWWRPSILYGVQRASAATVAARARREQAVTPCGGCSTPVFHGFARLYTDDEVLEHGLDFGKVQGDSG